MECVITSVKQYNFGVCDVGITDGIDLWIIRLDDIR
jgi:hypothetical protein